jgi:flagellar basal body rod protein FlgG
MAGSAYIALSGLRTRADQLERLASDIANSGTAGYKAERSATEAAERPSFADTLRSAVDVAPGPVRVDFRPGTLGPTGRDLDLAIEGRGFFVVETPAGLRYTRNGHFERQSDGALTTADGFPVLGDNGPLRLGPGPIGVDDGGTVSAGGVTAGRLRIVDFDDKTLLGREEAARFRAPDGVNPAAVAAPQIRTGSLEASNVSIVDRIATLTEVSRNFEALQRAVSLMMNDIDGRAISELGRR